MSDRCELNIANTRGCQQSFMNGTLIADDISNSISLEIAHKKIDLSRWGEIGKNIKLVRIGMNKNEVLDLLGKPNKYPMDNASIWQYLPYGNFNGGKDGQDWNFVILFNTQDKVKTLKIIP